MRGERRGMHLANGFGVGLPIFSELSGAMETWSVGTRDGEKKGLRRRDYVDQKLHCLMAKTSSRCFRYNLLLLLWTIWGIPRNKLCLITHRVVDRRRVRTLV